MKLRALRASDRDQWVITLNDREIVSFSGPGAQQRANADRQRLAAMLNVSVDNGSAEENADVQD